MLPILIIELPFLAEREVPKIHRFYEQLLFNVESLETLGKLDTIEGATYYVVKKLEVIKAELVAHVETNWRNWTFRDLVNALRNGRRLTVSLKRKSAIRITHPIVLRIVMATSPRVGALLPHEIPKLNVFIAKIRSTKQSRVAM